MRMRVRVRMRVKMNDYEGDNMDSNCVVYKYTEVNTEAATMLGTYNEI